jgi:hypothetical protein
MRKDSFITVSALALIGSIAIAAPPPVKKLPSFTDNGATLTASGHVMGLAAGDYEIKLSATGTESTVCGDAEGTDPAPKEVVLTGTVVISATANMPTAYADLVSAAPEPGCLQAEGEPIAGQQEVSFTKASLEIRPVQTDPEAAPLKPVRCIQCSFIQATVDGPAKPASCLTMYTC